jgi:hypothetical protein
VQTIQYACDICMSDFRYLEVDFRLRVLSLSRKELKLRCSDVLGLSIFVHRMKNEYGDQLSHG